MADNYKALAPTTAPAGTVLFDAAAQEFPDGSKGPKVVLYAVDGTPIDFGALIPPEPQTDALTNTQLRAAPVPISLAPATPARYVGLSTTGQVVKAAAGTLRGYAVFNTSSATRFVKVYNKGTVPTEGDTPALTIAVSAGGGANLDTAGIAFSAGISLRATTGVADNDTGAPGANEVIVQVWYV